jgi:hypothetical protein
MIEKIKEHGIDLFILVVDYDRNRYVVEDYKAHADYNSYKLIFTFEDWSGIINDGNEHIHIVAEYRNAEDKVLVKYQDEDFDNLLLKVKAWNENHKIAYA